MKSNKKLAKNTFALYLRMIFTICVGLYTSRVILDTLGISDFGIYNVVGGICVMMSFLNTGMATASQRFISYGLGKGENNQINRIFCTSMNIHFLIATIIFLLAESVGLWYLNFKMNIPEGRMMAANWVYQFSIFSFIMAIWNVPYNSCLIAHEDLKIYAYIGIYESIIKLLIAYCLIFSNSDKLIIYSLLILFTQVSVCCFSIWFCKRRYQECVYHFIIDKELSMKMFSFAGWSIFGNLGFATRDQGSNLILNIFYGTSINAARGIAGQLNAIINSFANNFIVALNPQITKLYASNEIEQCKRLVYSGARFSFYLLSIIITPFLLNMDYVLSLWLKDVPQYTNIFLSIILLSSLLYAISQPVTTALQATGQIKKFQLSICLLLLSEIPAAYIILYYGMEPYWALIPMLVSNLIAVFIRIILLHQINSQFDIIEYVLNVVLKSILTFVCCFITAHYIHCIFPVSFFWLIIHVIFIIIFMSCIILTIGISQEERLLIFNIIKEKIGIK